MKKLTWFLGFVFAFCISIVAFAADEPAPDFGMALMQLFAVFRDKAELAVILMAVFQVLKTVPVGSLIAKLGGNYQRLILAIISVGASVVTAYQVKLSWTSAIIEGLFVAGGAMLIYDAIRAMKAPVPEVPPSPPVA